MAYIQLAPMEGVLDWVLREMLSEVGGLDRMVTEFVRVTDKLLPDHVFHRYCPELKQNGCTQAGTPVFVQLLGGEPGPLAENAARVVELGAPGIDLNFGCPAKTVNRHDGGAALLQKPRRLYDVTRAVREAVPAHIPVTAKVRLGFDHKEFHKEIAQAVEEAGAEHIVVHARTKTEMYQPPAHWEYIASMHEGRSLKFVANGEIWTVDDYLRCTSVSGVTDVALGRGLVRRPTLALEIRAHLEGRMTAVEFARVDFLRDFFQRSRDYRGGIYAVARVKQILRYWSAGDTEALMWFNEVKRMQDERSVLEFLAALEQMSWPKFKSTPRPIVHSAAAPKIY
jgi:tRNA-dihydrouridine synthase C